MVRNARKIADGNELHIPGAELDVLACLWRHGKATVREVREALHRLRPLTHSSVGTLLGRLEDKGLVVKEKGDVGKAFVYAPTRRPAAGYREVAGGILRRVFDGNTLAFMTSLLEVKPLAPDELQAMYELLDGLSEGSENG